MTKVKHHYVPKFHLFLFTDDQCTEKKIWVFDLKSGNQWHAAPASVGYEKKLYNVELPDTAPDVVEDVFSEVEDSVAPIIKEIINRQKIPNDFNEYSWLVNYIALLSQRTPARMNQSVQPLLDVTKQISKMILSSPEIYENIKQGMKKEGKTIKEDVSYEELRSLVYGEHFNLSTDNNTRLTLLFNAIDAILPSLGARNWSVCYSPPEVGDFILSDNPVNLHWTTKKNRGIWSSPGYELRETEVSIPLSSRIMLLGRFEEMPAHVSIRSRRDLASLNSYTALHSKNFIFSRQRDFLWYMIDNSVKNTSDLKQIISKKTPK